MPLLQKVALKMSTLCRRGGLDGDALETEISLVNKLIHHLIRKDNILIVVEAPEQAPDESRDEWARRYQRERILAANPNYVLD